MKIRKREKDTGCILEKSSPDFAEANKNKVSRHAPFVCGVTGEIEILTYDDLYDQR